MPRRVSRGEPDSAQVRERRALDDLFTATYQELRRRASRSVRRGDARITLTPTGVVNEAWFKLARSPELGAKSPAEFVAIAAHAMRQVLIEAARRRQAQRRQGGAGIVRVPLDDAPEEQVVSVEELLALDEGLQELAAVDPQQAVLVEQRYFGGRTIAELAEFAGVSEATVKRDLRAAGAWLKGRLRV
jgi:RNA polymerase sigma factor (TIGR02999 family)